MIIGHGGNVYQAAAQLGCRVTDILDMSSNVNPLGPMPGLTEHLAGCMERIAALPEVDAAAMIQAFAHTHGIAPETVLAANGSTQFIYTLPYALNSRRALVVAPAYADYADACVMHRVACRFLVTGAETGFVPPVDRLAALAAEADLVFICNPNNPTGVLLPPDTLVHLARRHPDTIFVVDESYMPFVAESDAMSLLRRLPPNMVLLNSLSKIFRIPGLRIGFIVAQPSLIQRLQPFMLPWNVNALAQEAVIWLADHDEKVKRFVAHTTTTLAAEQKRVINQLDTIPGLTIFPSATAYLLTRLPEGFTADRVCQALLQKRILVRNCDNFKGLSERHLRFSLKTGRQNDLLVRHLEEILSP